MILTTKDYAVYETLTWYESKTYFYCGYRFRVSEEIAVTSLIAGVQSYRGEPGYVALYYAIYDFVDIVPWAVLGSAVLNSEGRNQTLSITPVTLSPNTWYIVAVGASKSGLNDGPVMSGVESFSSASVVAAEPYITDWVPVGLEYSEFGTLLWKTSGNPGEILFQRPQVGALDHFWERPYFYDTRPEVGFVYTPGTARNIWVKKSDIWEDVPDLWVHKGGVWEEVTGVWVKKGDEWKTV